MFTPVNSPQTAHACRFCGVALRHSVVDLGMSPPCQKHVTPAELDASERFYPLHVFVCDGCWLVQIPAVIPPDEIFTSEYAYFSSYADTWLRHAKAYTDLMTSRLDIGRESLVVEIASNDGYLLQYFVEKGVPVLGVEPTANTAAKAVEKGIPTLVKFFGRATAAEIAAERGRADLLLGNNVLAHVPDLNDFVGGMSLLLAPRGTITMEFPHLVRLIDGNQFDTIYHEHFSYLSFSAVETVFAAHGLTLFDVEELPTHGGSIRIYARHADDSSRPVGERVTAMRAAEETWGVKRLETYATFAERVRATKRKLLDLLIDVKGAGKRVVGYGAPGKGNTLLNYCGIRTDFLDYTVDRSPHKQGNFLPGTRIPILAPETYRRTRPDYVLILPWNLEDEIVSQTAYIREWGGKWIVPIPEARIRE